MKSKSAFIYLLFFIVISLFLFSKINAAGNNDPYSMFRCDPEHSGIYPSDEVKIKPDIKWRFKTNGIITSSAAISDDKIYFGSGDENLYCLNLQSGTRIWSYKTNGEVFSSPLLYNGNVYFESYDGNFYALDQSNGKVKWIFSTAGEKRFSAPGIHGAEPMDSVFQDSFDLLLSSPVIYDNLIYFTTGSGYCYAVDASTGKEIWKFKTGNVAHTSPAAAYGNVYFGSWDTYMYAVNARTGSEIWKFKTGEDTEIYNQTGLTSSPVISDGILYTGCRDSYLYAIDAYTGKEIWKRYNRTGWVTVTPVVYGNRIIYATGDTKFFAALNKRTGDSVYQHPTRSGTQSSPSIAGKMLYYGDMAGFLFARDIETGTIAWSVQVDGSKKDVYEILNTDYTLNVERLYKLANGGPEKKEFMDIRFSVGCIISSPVIKDKVIYFGSTDKNFYAFQ